MKKEKPSHIDSGGPPTIYIYENNNAIMRNTGSLSALDASLQRTRVVAEQRYQRYSACTDVCSGTDAVPRLDVVVRM